jgi:PKD repeat protein
MAEGKSGMGGFVKASIAAVLGLTSGAVATYFTAIVDKVVKPTTPVANFAVSADGLTVTCQNHGTGESGWWDFGDGTPLEPFAPDAKSVAHTYAKPGTYPVKLTVRNFLSDENERIVPVDLTKAAAPGALPPSITGLTVEPIEPRAMAPATFRIRGEVKNAEKVIWDLGDKLEVSTAAGAFDRLVVFDKPGKYPIQLIGHAGTTAIKQAATVTVSAPAAGSLSTVLRVQDSGTRVERIAVTEIASFPVPAKGTKAFEKSLPARPGCTIAEAKLGELKPGTVVKGVKVEVAADRRSMKVSGEWVLTGPDATKAVGGSDVMVPVAVVEEKATPVNFPPEMVSAPLDGWSAGSGPVLALPPQPRGVSNLTRKIALEIREAGADGRSQVVASAADVKFPWTGGVPASVSRPTGLSVSATQAGDTVRIALGRGR